MLWMSKRKQVKISPVGFIVDVKKVLKRKQVKISPGVFIEVKIYIMIPRVISYQN